MSKRTKQPESEARYAVRAECQACGWTGEIEPCDPRDIPDLANRLDPGGTVPVNTCPAPCEESSDGRCGALLYAVKPPDSSDDSHILKTLRGVASVIDATFAHDENGNRIETEAGISGADCIEALSGYELDITRAIALADRSALVENAKAMHVTLCDLVRWADSMGGWEAPIWERARHLSARADESRDYTEPEKHTVLIEMEGGLIQNVEIPPALKGTISVKVHDYDTEVSTADLHDDENGQEHTIGTWE